MKSLLIFSIFMMAVMGLSAFWITYYDGTKYISSCSCLNNECNLAGFSLMLHEDYCSKRISISIDEPIFSYVVAPNVTCSVARDCFYNSSLFGCRDMTDYESRVSGWCCYDNCKLLHYKHSEDMY